MRVWKSRVIFRGTRARRNYIGIDDSIFVVTRVSAFFYIGTYTHMRARVKLLQRFN